MLSRPTRGQSVTPDICQRIGGKYNGDHGSGEEYQFKSPFGATMITVTIHSKDGVIVTAGDVIDGSRVVLLEQPTARRLVDLLLVLLPGLPALNQRF